MRSGSDNKSQSTKSILDTPCAAGARSDGLRPTSQQRISHVWSKTTCIRLAAYARSRHIAENFQKVQYQAWSGGYLFLLTSCKKVPETVSRNGSLNRLIPVANPNKWRVLSRPSKIHNPNNQGPAACVPPPHSLRQKVIIIRTNGRTDEHQFFLSHGWKKRFAQIL